MTLPDPQRIATNPRINAFVMANAGSGKTTTLVNRVARLLLSGSRPDAVLCLTFTKAAAAEMQRRLYQTLGRWAVAADADLRVRLADLEERAPEDYDAERLSLARSLFARALETPGGLKIQTIHAFCEQLLRRFPVEAGVSPSFRVVDEAEAAAVVARAREVVARLSLTGELPGLSDAYAAMSENLAHEQFEAMFACFESKRAALAAYVQRSGDLAALPQAIADAVGIERIGDPDEIIRSALTPPALDPERWLWAAAAAARSPSKTDQALEAGLRAVAEAALRGEVRVDDARRIFFTGDGAPRKTVATRSVDTAVCAWLGEEQERLRLAFDAARTTRVAVNTVHALTLAGVYARQYEQAKRDAGVLDFADLIERAKALLTSGAGAAWVLYKLDRGVDHMLIDEAQDTSPEQWEIARALSEEFFAGAGPRTDGVERTVFVVGDEKQSIFSFQGAAPERLLRESQTYDLLITGAGREFRSVPLLKSYRSTPEVLKLVDAVFASPDLAAALSPGRGRASDPLVEVVSHEAARADGPGTVDLWPEEKEEPGGERRAWDAPVDSSLGGGARRRVAERIVREVRGLIEAGEAVLDKESRVWRPAGWGDVLVLVKTRGPMFDEVLRRLKQSGVPVAGADRLKLGEHPVFEDLLALGRAALYAEDDLNLAAVLRSPLCDVDEQGLFDLAQAREGRLWTALRTRADERPEWRAAYELIRWFERQKGERTPFDLYGRLLNRRDSRGLTQRQRFMTRLGAEAGDAIDAFLDQAHSAEGRGITDLERFCAALSSLEQTVKREMDEPRGEVRVMTAHSAKGLEAPIVILPDTIFEAPRGDQLLETEEGGFLWCARKTDDCEASARARARRKQREEEEALRLLYVGLTRARDRLIIGGRLRSDRKIENIRAWWGPLTGAFAALAAEVREVQTPSGTAWRYGADPQRLPRGAAASAEAPVLPAWLFEEPLREREARRAAPSQLEGAKGGSSPLVRPTGLGRFRRGDLIHKLLEILPEVPEAARATTAADYLARQPDLDDAQRAEMAQAALGVLAYPRFTAVFGPGSRAEAAVAGEAPELPGRRFSGRLDRLLVTDERVLVIDFKSNRPAPSRIEDADPAYLKQMAAYVAVLRRVYPGRAVEAALLWTDGPALVRVPGELIDRTLIRMAAG